MTLGEWSGVHTAMTALWKQHKAPEEEQMAAEHAALPPDLPVEAAMAAAREIWLSGEKWPPSGGEIAARAMKALRPPAPAPGTVIALLKVAAGTYGREREAEAIRWLASESPHAARFAVEHGWRQFCMEGIDDPEFGGAVRQRLERSASGCVAGLEREFREGRVLPLVSDHLRRLDRGLEARSGLRHLKAGDVIGFSRAAGETPLLDAMSQMSQDDEGGYR